MTTSPPTSDRAEARTGPIVVGVDGSEGSIAALQWAATEARAQGRPLTVIHVVASLASSGFPLAPVPGMDEALMAGAESTLDNALAAAFGDERPAGIRREVARGLLGLPVGARPGDGRGADGGRGKHPGQRAGRGVRRRAAGRDPPRGGPGPPRASRWRPSRGWTRR